MVTKTLTDPTSGWGETAGGGPRLRDFANQVMTSGKVDNFEGVVVLGELLEFVPVSYTHLTLPTNGCV